MSDIDDIEVEVVENRSVLVCHGSYCNINGRSMKIIREFKLRVKDNNLSDDVDVKFSGCMGFCKHAPMVCVTPEGTPYHRVHLKDVIPIVESHCLNGKVLEEKVLKFHGNS